MDYKVGMCIGSRARAHDYPFKIFLSYKIFYMSKLGKSGAEKWSENRIFLLKKHSFFGLVKGP